MGENIITVDKRHPLVSIITPCFNAYPYIEETIKSVNEQDYPSVEHIIIDGGSADGTITILKKYSHLVWVSEQDHGQSDAINKGFSKAHGELIGWLNADDTYCPGAIKEAVNYFSEHPDVDLIYTDVQIIDDNSRVIERSYAKPFSLETILFKNVVKQPSVFMRRRLLDVVGSMNIELHYVMDHEFWLRAGIRNTLRYIPGLVFANFRYCEGTKSYDDNPLFHLEWVQVLNKFFDKLEPNNILHTRTAQAIRKSQQQYYFSLMTKTTSTDTFFVLLRLFVKGIICDWKSIFSIGTWKLLVREIYKNSFVNKYKRQ